MVTVAAGLLLLGLLFEPALAAKASRSAPWGDLFGIDPPKLRGTVHRAAVPLPRPRPADAPNPLRSSPKQG